MKLFRRHISAGLVVAIAALVVALAGTSIALPGRKKVDKNDFKKGAVKTKALGKSAVTRGKLANGAVNGAKLANGAVNSAKLGTITTRTSAATIPNGQYGEATASCQGGEKLISGGASVNNTQIDEFELLNESYKVDNAWYVRMFNGSGVVTPRTLTVYAYCLG